MSISRSRGTNNKGKGRLRLSLRIKGILGRIGTTIIRPEEILLVNLGLLLPRWSAQYSESWCLKF